MIKKWEEGYDVVFTFRTYPKEISFLKEKHLTCFINFYRAYRMLI